MTSLFGLIPLLVGLLRRRTPALTEPHAERQAWGLVVAVLVLAAIAGFAIWDHFDDADAVDRALLEERTERAERRAEANAAAGAAKAERDALDDEQQDRLEDMTDDAQAAGTSAADDVWNGGLWDDPGD